MRATRTSILFLTVVFGLHGFSAHSLATEKFEPDLGLFGPSTFAPTGEVAYKVIDDNRVEVTISDAHLLIAQLAAAPKLTADKLLQSYIDNKNTEQQVYDAANKPGVHVSTTLISLADEERVVSDLKAEVIFYDSLSLVSKTLGISVLGTTAAYLSQQLTQMQGLPPARIALVLSTLAAGVAEGTSTVIENKLKTLRMEIDALQAEIDARENYLNWASEYGGDTSVPFEPPTCIYKTTCVETKVCTTESIMGTFKKSCTPTSQCYDELLTCRD